MTENEKAKKTFWDGCIQHIRNTYAGLKGRRVYVYGSGEFGRFLSKKLVEHGCVEPSDIKGYINDFANGFQIEGIPVLSFDQCDFTGDDYCVVVGILNAASSSVINRLQSQKIKYVADTRSGMLNIVGPMLCALSEHPETMSPGNILAKIDRFHALNLPEKEMAQLYDDEQSLAVLHNRLDFFRTGRYELLETICPVTTMEYFGTDLLEIGEHEYYVDCGAYDGDSVLDFIGYTQGKYDQIVAFEPDAANFAAMERNLAGMPNIELIKAATGQIAGEVLFSEGGQMGSAIDLDAGTRKVRMVRLDDYFKVPVTFVKMDIEGAELDTLKGMERILKECRPKLAVCVYHKVEDIYTIPKFIQSVVPEYHFKLRQHRPCIYGTVLYADV